MPSATKEFAGTLQRRVTIEQASETGGDAVVTWTTVATVWASVRALGGSEASGLRAEVVYEFRTRFRNDINFVALGPRHTRLGFPGSARKFDVTAVFDPTDDHKDLLLHATELV